MELAAKMTNENPENALKMLEKDENEQKTLSKPASTGSLQGDIIARTIALAKAKQQ
tara:strand:- start:30 stop:197 length:168 start_codon:yes stop_codon:yes gene_type:complete